MQTLEVDMSVLQCNDQINCVFLVAQKQILGMATGNLPSQNPGLFNGEQRRMLYGRVLDTQGVELGEKLFWRFRHPGINPANADPMEVKMMRILPVAALLRS